MTQHHDPVHPDEHDLEPFVPLSADDDAYVSALLADLPEVPMPLDVRARLDAALADLATAEPVVRPTVGATVVPLSSAPSSRWRNPRVLQAAAGLVLVAAAVFVGIKVTGSNGSAASPTSAGAASSSEALALTRSGTAYTTASLSADVQKLVAHKLPPAAGGTTSGSIAAPSVPSGSPQYSAGGPTPEATTPTGALDSSKAAADAKVAAIAANATSLAPCIAAIEDGMAYVNPYAIDVGTFNGQAALLVVLPSAQDPASYDVFVVGSTCGVGNDADLISYHLVPRS
ncbi:MAG TPA: hypothetical protein VIJ54_09800 [Actinomycetes bacterium]